MWNSAKKVFWYQKKVFCLRLYLPSYISILKKVFFCFLLGQEHVFSPEPLPYASNKLFLYFTIGPSWQFKMSSAQ